MEWLWYSLASGAFGRDDSYWISRYCHTSDLIKNYPKSQWLTVASLPFLTQETVGGLGELSFSLQIQWVCFKDSALVLVCSMCLHPLFESASTEAYFYYGKSCVCKWTSWAVQAYPHLCSHMSVSILLPNANHTTRPTRDRVRMMSAGGCCKVAWQGVWMRNREWRIGTRYSCQHPCIFWHSRPIPVGHVSFLHQNNLSLVFSMCQLIEITIPDAACCSCK